MRPKTYHNIVFQGFVLFFFFFFKFFICNFDFLLFVSICARTSLRIDSVKDAV